MIHDVTFNRKISHSCFIVQQANLMTDLPEPEELMCQELRPQSQMVKMVPNAHRSNMWWHKNMTDRFSFLQNIPDVDTKSSDTVNRSILLPFHCDWTFVEICVFVWFEYSGQTRNFCVAQAADYICMDTPITYNDLIPTQWDNTFLNIIPFLKVSLSVLVLIHLEVCRSTCLICCGGVFFKRSLPTCWGREWRISVLSSSALATQP